MKWAYGVTTIPERKNDLLPRTLQSLRIAGFPDPRLFVDGCTHTEASAMEQQFCLPVTARNSNVRTYGNWILSLWEIYVRNPNADRYAVFQDDFITYPNLRLYLEHHKYPGVGDERGYWNLYTFPVNHALAPTEDYVGWHRSDQLGKGAVALVFNKDAVVDLLASQHMALRPQCAKRGWRAVDGGIVEAFRKAKWTEYVHSPSLVQHTGEESSMGNRPHALADSWRGEDFDALDLVEKCSLGIPSLTPCQ